jgi:molybdenum cofactor sulfurtransferase
LLTVDSIVRASVSAMTTRQEVDMLLHFMQDTFVEQDLDWKDSATLCSAQDIKRVSFEGPTEYTFAPLHEVRELPRPHTVFSASHGAIPRMSLLPDAFQSMSIMK